MRAGGFQDDGRDVGIALHGLLHGVQVAGRHDDHAAPGLGRDAGSRPVGAGHGVVMPAVEVVLQFDDLVAPGVGAGQPHRHQRGLGAAAVEPDTLDGRHKVHDRPGPAQLLVGAGAQVSAAPDLLGNGVGDGGMRMSQDQRAVAGNVVDVLVAVHVPLARPLPVGDVQREGLRVAVVVGNAAREDSDGVAVTLCGAGVSGDVLFQDGGHFQTPFCGFRKL